jgi:hypothetical protein
VEPEPNNPPPKPTTKPTKPVVVAPTPPAGGAAAGRRGTAPPPARQGGGAETPTTTTPPVAQVQPPVNPPTQTPTPTPPMKEPVETPAPAPPVTKPTPPPDSGKPQVLSPAQEEQRIRTALEQYENAYDTLNASAVRAIFPGAPATLEKAFAQYEFYRLELVVQRIRLAPDGMSATAECTLSHFFRPRVGRDQDFRRNQEFTFQKRGNSWIIVRVR